MKADIDRRLQECLADIPHSFPQIARPIIIIGAGGIVHDAHLPAYRLAGFPVAALVDTDLEKAGKLAREFSVPLATTSIRDAIAKSPPDCVFDVAVPAQSLLNVLPHLPDGAAVLIQKPMGESLDEAERILELCRARGFTAAVNFQLRYAPAMLSAQKIASKGLLGDLHDMEVQVSVFTPWHLWSFLATNPRLEILYHSIHYIDLVRSWFGNPQKVLARTVRSPQTPTLAATKSVILMDYGEWKRVYIATNHSHRFQNSQHSYVQWEGTEGALHAVMGVNLDYPTGSPDTLSYAEIGGAWQSLPVKGNWFPDAFAGSMGALQAYVSGTSKVLPTSVEDAIHTMRVVEAAYDSSQQDGVPLKG